MFDVTKLDVALIAEMTQLIHDSADSDKVVEIYRALADAAGGNQRASLIVALGMLAGEAMYEAPPEGFIGGLAAMQAVAFHARETRREKMAAADALSRMAPEGTA